MHARAFAPAIVGLVFLTGAASAAPATRPDITGFWEPQGNFNREVSAERPVPPHEPGGYYYWPNPPLQPWADKYYRDAKAREMQGYVVDELTALCLPRGFPMFWMWGPIDITERRGPNGEVSKLTMATWSERMTPRHIWMDGRKNPEGDDLLPNPNGYSVGRWEGDVLVIDTVGISEDTEITSDHIPHTADLRIVERIHFEQNGRVMINELTMHDPKTFTKPWALRLVFNRLPDNTQEPLLSVCDVRHRGTFGKPGDFEGAEGVGGFKPLSSIPQ